MNITLQKITGKDIQIYMDMENSVTDPKTYPWKISEKEAHERIADANISYFIKLENMVVGNIRASIVQPGHAYIRSIVIRPEFQGKGIGTEAMKILLENELKDMNRVDLVTHPENKKAISMYKKLGFLIESKKENYYGDGEPRIIMARNIK